MNKISIQYEDFDISTEINLVHEKNSSLGAIVSFVGMVRDLRNEALTKLTLEHYPEMTEKALQEITDKAKSRWKLGDITIIHRVGELEVNDRIVLVIATSRHRKDAFSACEFIIDYLKTDAPFWKKEHTKDGSKWIDNKYSDKLKKDSWS